MRISDDNKATFVGLLVIFLIVVAVHQLDVRIKHPRLQEKATAVSTVTLRPCR